MKNNPQKIGVFGGSFDPPHIGHFICARSVAEQLDLSKVLVIPVSIGPFKPEGSLANDDLRLKMISAAIEDDPLFELSTTEIDRGGISYTVDTLRTIREEYPDPEFELNLIIGADAMQEIHRWKEPEEIMQLSHIAVMDRSGQLAADIFRKWAPNYTLLHVPHIDISSTIIRERSMDGLPVRWMVGQEVASIINEFHPYYHI